MALLYSTQGKLPFIGCSNICLPLLTFLDWKVTQATGKHGKRERERERKRKRKQERERERKRGKGRQVLSQ